MSDELGSGITAFLPVYNEEKRIRKCLECFQWCDEILLLDKESTDDTIAIAKQFPNVTVLTKEHTEAYDSDEVEYFLNNCKTEWCMVVTASDLIHSDLAVKLKELIYENSTGYDIFSVPYKPYFLGCCERYSPWYSESRNKAFRTSSMSVNLKSVHSALNTTSNRIYTIKMINPQAAYYHLSHQSADSVIERNVRYWKGEASSSEPLSSINKIIIREVIRFVFLRGGLFKGKQAIALFYSFLSYYMMTYVCKWDFGYGEIEDVYEKLRKEIVGSWMK